jgi:hypothetical protein
MARRRFITVEMSSDSPKIPPSTPFEDLRKADKDQGIDRSEKRKKKILEWIQNWLLADPEGLNENASTLAQRTFTTTNMDEEFPALPQAKSTAPSQLVSFNLATLKFTNLVKSLTKKTESPLKNAIEGKDATALQKNKIDENLSKYARDISGNLFPLAPWVSPRSGHFFSTGEQQSIGGDPSEIDDPAEIEDFVNRKISGASHGSWQDCRCKECYEEHEEEFKKHMQDCEDCREEYFNHNLFDGESQEYWIRLERKLGNEEEICRLCRWKRDLAKHPFERARSSGT